MIENEKYYQQVSDAINEHRDLLPSQYIQYAPTQQAEEILKFAGETDFSAIFNKKIHKLTDPTITSFGLNGDMISDFKLPFILNCPKYKKDVNLNNVSNLLGLHLNKVGNAKITVCPKLDYIKIDSYDANCNFNLQSLLNLQMLDFGEHLNGVFPSFYFFECWKLKYLIIRDETQVAVGIGNTFPNDGFFGTSINGIDGFIYVPNNMLDAYKNSNYWSSVPQNYFKPIGEFGFVQADGSLTILDRTVLSGVYSGDTSITNVYAPYATIIEGSAFMNCTNLAKAIFTNCESYGSGALFNCTALEELQVPMCLTVAGGPIGGNGVLTKLEFPHCLNFGGGSLMNNTNLKILKFDSASEIQGGNFPNSLEKMLLGYIGESPITYSGFANTNCTIYVPEVMLEKYKTTPPWSMYADQFLPITQWEED